MELIYKPIVYICIIILAALLKKINIFKSSDGKLLSKIVMNFTLPAAIISSFGSYERTTSLLLIIPIGLLCSSVPLFFMFFLTKKISLNERIFYMINLGGHNIGSFALPIMTCFFGHYGTIICCMFDIGNAILMTGGSYALTCSLLKLDKTEKKLSVLSSVKIILKRFFSSFPLDVYIVMLLFVLLNIQVPQTVINILSPIASANAFLSMFMIGLMFSFCLEKNFLTDITKLVLLRIFFSICAALLIFFFTPFPFETRYILAIIAFSPIGSLASVYVGQCKGDTAKSSCATTISIMISFAIMFIMSSFIIKTNLF